MNVEMTIVISFTTLLLFAIASELTRPIGALTNIERKRAHWKSVPVLEVCISLLNTKILSKAKEGSSQI